AIDGELIRLAGMGDPWIFAGVVGRARSGRTDDAAESEVAHAGVDHLGLARGRSIPEAIGPRAEMRTALDHLAGNRELRLSRIVAALTVAATRVLRHAARRDIAAGRGAVPIR